MKLLHVIVFSLTACMAGCTGTVTPDPVSATQASFDGGAQTSGIITSADGGYVITARARERYNALIETYGAKWSPAIGQDYGCTPYFDGQYFLTNEALVKFLTMNQWRKMGGDSTNE